MVAIRTGHWVERDGHRFISLSVKMAPGDRVAGLNRFKLIVRENFGMAQPLVMRMAREAQVLLQDHRLVRVQINDWPEQALPFFEPAGRRVHGGGRSGVVAYRHVRLS